MPTLEVNKPKAQYLNYLDATRGIAALMVCVSHFINWRYKDLMGAKIASLAFDGEDAVSFFFVLSGFVLSYKYVTLGKSLDIRRFYINRFFRIWPAFFVAVLLNALYWNRHDISFHRLMDLLVYNKQHFWEEALLIRPHTKFYGPGWTLYIEMTLSFFIPFAVVLAKKDRKIIPWLLFATLLIGWHFLFHFILGVLISCVYWQVTAPSFKQTKWYKYRYPIILAAIPLFTMSQIDRISPIGPSFQYIMDYFTIGFWQFSAIASFIFIIVCLQNKKIQQVLSHSWFRFLGKISYGIYLMHWLLVAAIYDYWHTFIGIFHSQVTTFFVMLIVFMAGTVLLAILTHYFIEKPFIRWGKKLTGRLKPSLAM